MLLLQFDLVSFIFSPLEQFDIYGFNWNDTYALLFLQAYVFIFLLLFYLGQAVNSGNFH